MKRFVDVVIADYEYIKHSLWNYVWLSNYNFSLPISQLDLPSWKTISFFKVGWTFNYRLATVRGVCKNNGEHLDMRFKIYSGQFAKVLGVYLDKAWEKVSWRLKISPEFTKLWKIWAPEECLKQVQSSDSISDKFVWVKVIFGQSWWFVYFLRPFGRQNDISIFIPEALRAALITCYTRLKDLGHFQYLITARQWK